MKANKMAKFLALVEVDTTLPEGEQDVSRFTLIGIADRIGALGEHVTVEKFVNLDRVERKEGMRVDEKVWGPDDTYPQVSVQPSKFEAGQFVEVILLPSDSPSKATTRLR